MLMATETETRGQRLARARSEAKLSQKQLATRSGVSQQLISKLERDAVEDTAATIAIARALGKSAEWLDSGAGPEAPAGGPIRSRRHAHANVEAGPNIITTVPLISWVQAGEWSEVVDLFEPGEADEWVPTTRHVGPHAFAVRVKGDSMTAPHGPSFPEGTKLIVDPTASADHGSFVIAKLASDQEATFKRLAFDGPRRYLQPLNQAYQTIDITERDCVICGVVVQATPMRSHRRCR